MIIKRHMYVILVIGFGMTTSMKSQKQKVMQTTISKEEQAVLGAVASMTKSFNNADIEGVMSSYQEGALVVFEPEMRVTNKKQLRELFLAAFAIKPQFEYPNGHEVFVNGNSATHIAPWIMKGTAPDGTAVTQSGLSVAHLQKQSNGKWLLIFDNPHGSYLMSKKP
ncbi:YybH family protein [Flagellimonas flava]|uniref:YybH family protein n=1 Tax=Flagellimonas flava TaxID=570519 RepID=UPI003D65461C